MGLALLVVGAKLYLTPHDWAALFGRDLQVYQEAVDAFAAGQDPYHQLRNPHGFLFTAPPFVWLLYKLVAKSGLKILLGPGLLAADLVSIAALPLIFSRLFLGSGSGRAALGAGFFFTAFAGAGFFTALVVNNGTPLYALIAAGLIPAVKRNQWLGFHLAVALATAFKPFYAAFWIVPLLADGASLRQWAASIAGFGLATATYLAPMLIAPGLMSSWLHTLVRGTVSEGLLGDNLLGAVSRMPIAQRAHAAAYAAQLGFSAVLLIAALGLGRMERSRRIAGLVLVAVFLNPRAMRYDLSTAAIPLLAVVAGVFAKAPPGATRQAAWAAILGAVLTMFSVGGTADGLLYAEVVLVALLGAIALAQAPRLSR